MRLILRPVSKAMKEKKGKKAKKKTKVQNQTTLYCSALSVKTVKLLQNRTNKLTELIISSHGQYTQYSLLLRFLVICHASENSSSRRVISHNRQDLTLSLVRFKPYLNEGCKPADKKSSVLEGAFKDW